MQDTMVYEQEQLLFAIDDIDDATIMAESAVIGKIAELWLKTMMIQESVSPEYLEQCVQEGTFGEKLRMVGEYGKWLFVKIWFTIKNICKVIWNKTMKFISHFKPSYIADLVRTNNSALAHVAKKHGCKVRVETDGKLTLLLPFIDLTYFERWIKRNTSGVERMIKDLKAASEKGRKMTKIRELKYFDDWKFKDKAASDQLISDVGSGKYGGKGSQTDEQKVGLAKAQLALYPTKLMSLDEFTDYAETGMREHITGTPKKFQNLSQYMSEFIEKVDELCARAKDFQGKLNADADENLKQFAQSLVDTSTKFQTSVTEAQNSMAAAVTQAKRLAETIRDDLLHGSGKKEMDEYISKRSKSKNPETESRRKTELTNRNQEVINKLG